MSLRARLAVSAAAAVAITVVLVAAIAYRSSSEQQTDAADSALLDRAEEVAARAALLRDLDTQLEVRGRFFEPEGLLQIIDEDGAAARPAGQETLPITDADRAVAATGSGVSVRDIDVDGLAHRLVTVPVPAGDALPRFGPRVPGVPAPPLATEQRALQLAESRVAADDALAGLRRSLLFVAGLGVLVAAGVGLLVARRALRPVAVLTEAAEHVAATQDLDGTIAVQRNDEVGRLATAFNSMLDALGRSRRQQQQLVTDASHELRTPLTSLRTNVELLQRARDLPDVERRQIVDASVAEIEELSALVSELVQLATDRDRTPQAVESVALGDLVDRVAGRWSHRRAGPVSVTADDSTVVGQPELLERAIANLVDNAAKWSPESEPIDVVVANSRVSVRDRGPGIAPEERAQVFDRFHRAPGAQNLPGSGLGLAIVAQIVEQHDGTVFIEDPPDAPGVIVGFQLPTEPPSTP